ncbi:hypothetical protein AB0230_08810 [Microbacterium sp. NPDC089190]|uniref:hypothetical protein n=1 Tax=Microbacterium sp. NPDC089190 TaxID=3155063 RepID=UPI00344F1A41
MTTANNPVLGGIPIRRGFYDADANQGFGMDKAWHYHNLPSLTAQKYVLESTDRTQQRNGSWRMRAWAYKQECTTSGGKRTCKVVDEREVWGIYQPQSYDKYFGWPVKGKMGLQTMYCQQGGAKKCPSWVIISFQNAAAGVSSLSRSQATTPSVSPTPAVEQGLTPMQQKSQQELYESTEMQELFQQVESGEVVLTGSYTKLS